MEVTEELIDKLSRLSMLRFDADEKEMIRRDLEKMIGFIDKLKEVDTSGIEPLTHISENPLAGRPDHAGKMLSREEALKNAPQHDNQYFLVPKVIKKPS